ncbi:hypothetical protein H5410_001161 [Solanum commersonii]|uniref:Uncharacterized protein n=1 Tax=Solanum commersonii TaxID=4109 RepID=A0A9J6AYC1_SOLCO|nr:hypothetical protein H5410_001161 [Solanum commersonii]
MDISSTIPLNFSSYLTPLDLWNTQLYGILLEREGDSAMISWHAFLMGYGCGLVFGLFIMLSTQYPAWFSRVFEELEHIITTRTQKHKKRY